MDAKWSAINLTRNRLDHKYANFKQGYPGVAIPFLVEKRESIQPLCLGSFPCSGKRFRIRQCGTVGLMNRLGLPGNRPIAVSGMVDRASAPAMETAPCPTTTI